MCIVQRQRVFYSHQENITLVLAKGMKNLFWSLRSPNISYARISSAMFQLSRLYHFFTLFRQPVTRIERPTIRKYSAQNLYEIMWQRQVHMINDGRMALIDFRNSSIAVKFIDLRCSLQYVLIFNACGSVDEPFFCTFIDRHLSNHVRPALTMRTLQYNSSL